MSPLAKSIFVALSIALVVGGTLVLRSADRPVPPPARLTPGQLAEIAPQPRPEPPKASQPVNDSKDLPPPPPDEPEIEDGNGS